VDILVIDFYALRIRTIDALKRLYNSGSMWPSVVVHEHWPVSQRMIVEMGDYAWSEHIVTVFLACRITIKNVQVQLKVEGQKINQRNPKCQNIDELITAILQEVTVPPRTAWASCAKHEAHYRTSQ
jgi:hypothetical protein